MELQKQKWVLPVISVLCGFVFIRQLCGMEQLGRTESMFIITLIGILIAYGTYKYWSCYRCNLWIMLCSMVIVCVGIISFLLRTSGGDGVFEYHMRKLLACGLSGFSAVSYLISRIYEKLSVPSEETGKQFSFRGYFFRCFCVIFVGWLPVFLAYYPGIFAYDVHTQITMVKNAEYTTHHPLIHTLMLKFFYLLGERMGSYTTGIAIYTLFQMVLCALILSYVLWYLYLRRVKSVIRIGMLLFFALWPMNSLLVISATKDTLFSMFMLLFVVLTLRFLEEEAFRKSIPGCGMLTVSGMMVVLFRNNGKYALAVWAVIFVVFLLITRMEKWEKGLGIGLAIGMLCAGMLVNTVMVKATDAAPGSKNEMFSIPIAQIARCYAFRSSEMPPEMLNDIEKLGISTGDYVLPTADIAKGKMIIEGQEELFFRVWWKLFRQYSGVSIDAFLYINQGNISLDDVSHAHVYGSNPEERKGYLITSTAKGYGVEHYSLFPWLEQRYEELFTLNKCQEIPFLATLFAPAFYFWLLAACVLHAILTKNYKIIVVSMLLLAYYGTVLLGPCSLVRYMFPLIVSAPVLMVLELQMPCRLGRREEKDAVGKEVM